MAQPTISKTSVSSLANPSSIEESTAEIGVASSAHAVSIEEAAAETNAIDAKLSNMSRMMKLRIDLMLLTLVN